MIRKLLSVFRESDETFEGQESNETVVLILRRHRFTIYTKLSFFILALLVPIFVGLAFYSILVAGGYMNLFVLLSSIWYLAFWLLIFHALTIYALNVVILTDKRIIDNDQYGLWRRKISELHLSRIQDVSVFTKGIIQTTMHFGDIVVQTASSEKQFIFHEIPRPERVKDEIMKLLAVSSNGVRTP